MAKAEWGVKRLCQGCGAKFYDMLQDPITCPSCGNAFDPEVLRARRPRGNTAKAAKSPAVVPKPKPKTLDDDDDDKASEEEDLAAAELDDEIETDGDSGDDDLLDDTEDLEGDDDKIAAVAVKRDADDS